MREKKKKKKNKRREKIWEKGKSKTPEDHARLKTVIISIGSDYYYICVCALSSSIGGVLSLTLF